MASCILIRKGSSFFHDGTMNASNFSILIEAIVKKSRSEE